MTNNFQKYNIIDIFIHIVYVFLRGGLLKGHF